MAKFIPKTIKVGYQKRTDTYTKMLGYVIYYDEKGVLRKEKSWEGWRDKKIASNEFDNVPSSGFVLNRNVGGGGYYNARNAAVRVFDPRGFEFEITIPNLLFILENCTSTKGKGLEGDFVYCWEGTELVLLPVESADYQDIVKFSKAKETKLGLKDLTVGHTYLTKSNKHVVYIGKHYTYTTTYITNDSKGHHNYISIKNVQKHWFLDINVIAEHKKNNSEYTIQYNTMQLVSLGDNILSCVEDSVNENFNELYTILEKFNEFKPNQKLHTTTLVPATLSVLKELRYTNRVKTNKGTFNAYFDILNRWHSNNLKATHVEFNDKSLKIEDFIKEYEPQMLEVKDSSGAVVGNLHFDNIYLTK